MKKNENVDFFNLFAAEIDANKSRYVENFKTMSNSKKIMH